MIVKMQSWVWSGKVSTFFFMLIVHSFLFDRHQNSQWKYKSVIQVLKQL